MATVWINEFHYDNTGADTGEFVEIAGTAGTDLTGYKVLFYNGSDSETYGSALNLSGTLSDAGSGFGFLSFLKAPIQNGSPDGMALVDAMNNVLEFLSYEGVITAIGGAADGLTSVNIGVSEPSNTPVGHSLQLMGAGSDNSTMTWASAATSTAGTINTDQTLIPEMAAVPLPASMPLLLVGLVALRALKKRA